MAWLERLFRPTVELAPEYVQRIDAWRAVVSADEQQSIWRSRFVVVDVETTGLNVRKDRLLSIGAVSVEGERVVPGDGFDVVLQNDERTAHDNILIHGIGPAAQAGGEKPEEALLAFLEYVGKQPLVAFHADFDEMVIGRRLRETLGVRLPNPWLDLALLAPALVPQARLAHAGLDEWLDHFGLRALVRHRAADDAFATAELLLILLKYARRQGLDTVGSLLMSTEKQRHRMLGAGGA